jgi:3-hydroxyacyl-[acyl-carrier-protein] dehydratase
VTTLDLGAIRRLLPHGHPMVLLDRVVAVEPGVGLRAIKAISGSEPCYADVAPGLPPECYAYPSSLLVESFGQAAALLWLLSNDAPELSEDLVLMFAAARDCEFTGLAYPGDVLRHDVRLVQVAAGTAFVSGTTHTRPSRQIASFGSLIAAVRPRPSLVGASVDPAGTTAGADPVSALPLPRRTHP